MRFSRTLIPVLGALTVITGSILIVRGAGPARSTPRARAEYLNFVRPGLIIKVAGAEIAADGTIKARVRLTDPKGAGLDRLGVTTPGTVSCSLIAAFIPKGQTQYTSYTTRVQTSPITGVSATQAGADSGGTFEQVGDGEYVYTFRTKAPAGIDRTATHTIGAYGSRNLSEFDMGTQYDDDVFNFVPDGSKVTVTRDVIRTATCNKCHDDMAFHGGSRKTLELCILCHQPQTVDPDTGNSVDMPVMAHKIHMGSSLPSVKAGTPYKIIGNSQSVHDYSEIVFPADARNCLHCHEQGPAAQAKAVFQPNRAACGACHDNVNFDTGAGHLDLPQRSDNQCANCHQKEGELEFDASILGAHTIPRFSKTLQGVVFEILNVTGAAGKPPVVTFSIKDKAGNPISIKTMSRLNLVLAGPNTDYSSYVSEAALTAEGPGDGRYFWTFARALPADAKGSWTIGIEGRRDAKLMEGTTKEQTIREVGKNKVFYFSVDGSAMQKRRTVVSLDKCNACHGSLSLHGDNRNAIEQCILCHNPNTLGGNNSVDFKVMVHRIHTGKELERPYVIGNANFNEVGYPGDRRNCSACHVNGSEQLPGPENLLPTTETASPVTPMMPITAACTGCHTRLSVLSHALSNTTRVGEACATCHGRDAEMSVANVHAR